MSENQTNIDIIGENQGIQIIGDEMAIDITEEVTHIEAGLQGDRGPKGDTGLGFILPPVILAANKILTAADVGKVFLYDENNITREVKLPAADGTDILIFGFMVNNGDANAGFGLLIEPDGNDTIQLGNVETTPAIGNIKSCVQGSIIFFYNVKGKAKWFTQYTGSWDWDQ